MTEVTIVSKDQRRKAVVTADGIVRYFRATRSTINGAGWMFERQTEPQMAFHLILDLADAILNGPPKIHNGR